MLIKDVTVDFDKYMNTNEGLKSALEKICIYGFCFVSGTPVSTTLGTKVVAKRKGNIDHMESLHKASLSNSCTT